MATLKIRIKDSKFISHNNVNVESFTEHEVKGNGWIAKIYHNGNITCIATGTENDGIEKELKCTFKNKIVKVHLRIGDKKPKIIKLYEFSEWNNDGMIGLSGGSIEKRRVYFRDKTFLDFLEEHKISSIQHMNPNMKFKISHGYRNGRLEFVEELHSDGELEQMYAYMRVPKWSDGKSFKKYYNAKATNATWVCKTSWMRGEIINRVLYTELNPVDIIGIPK